MACQARVSCQSSYTHSAQCSMLSAGLAVPELLMFCTCKS